MAWNVENWIRCLKQNHESQRYDEMLDTLYCEIEKWTFPYGCYNRHPLPIDRRDLFSPNRVDCRETFNFQSPLSNQTFMNQSIWLMDQFDVS